MTISVLGATGMAGSRIVDEALRRGHSVTGISRNLPSTPTRERLRSITGNVLEPGFAELLDGSAAFVSSVHFTDVAAEPVIRAARASGMRLAVVGGAGSLYVAPGMRLVDSPAFPPEFKAEALAGGRFLDALHAETALDWTFLSPAMIFTPGERTGTFRLGLDDLLTAADGKSSISVEDFAIAMIDELEEPKHRRQRFTVGY